MSETKTVFEPDEIITLLDLMKKAAAHKELTLWEGAEKAVSKPFATYILDGKLLAFLAERNIKREMRPDTRNEIFTLVDENQQERVPGWAPSNYWNFKQKNGAYDLRIDLSVGFGINVRDRGIRLVPQAHGTFVSATDNLPNFRMFKALVESSAVAETDLLPVTGEIAASSGHIVVSFTELGLGGIRRIEDIFAEFTGSRDNLFYLSRSSQNPFDPNPTPHHQSPGDALFVIEPAQPKLFLLWKEQLKSYKAALTA